MRKGKLGILAIAALAGALLVAAVPASSHYALSGGRSCGHISFTPGTDLGSSHYGAGGIKAKGTTCGTAKKVARASKSHGGKAFRASGFSCKPKSQRHAGHFDYRCRKGGATIVFAGIGVA